MAEPWIPLGAALRDSVLEADWPMFSAAFCDANCDSVLTANSVLSAAAVVAGATVAYLGRRYPRHHDILERVGGILLIGGFSLLGYSLEVVLGRPAP
jgi:hypothetical protein